MILQRLSAAAPHALLLVDLAYTEFADVDLTATCLKLPKRRGGAHVFQGLGFGRAASWLRDGPQTDYRLAPCGRWAILSGAHLVEACIVAA
jgi:hypothetical protein